MPRGPAPQWRARKEPVLDSYVLASVEQAGGIGKHNTQGHYATLVIRDFESYEEAEEWSRALHRCAHFLARNRIADVSVTARIERDGAGHKITFKAIDKTLARKYVLEKYGTDRTKWPYNPRRKGSD